MLKLHVSAVAMLCSLGVAMPAFAAQVVVLDAKGSIAASMPTGTMIDDTSVDVPSHDELTVMGADGEAIHINGPHHGAIGAPSSGGSNVLAKFAEVIKERPSTLGATRGAELPNPDAQGKDDPWAIDATMGGTDCVFGNHEPMLWKPSSSTPTHVAIQTDGGGQSMAFDWPAGSTTAPWPSGLALADGSRYVLTMGDEHRTITVKKVGTASNEGSGSLIAANAGCSLQAKDLLKAVKPREVSPS